MLNFAGLGQCPPKFGNTFKIALGDLIRDFDVVNLGRQ
jgi:hypothetical protein